MPWLKEDASTRSAMKDYSEALEQQYHVCKPDNDPTIPIIMHYGQVPSITDRESIEVFEWFSTHQVKWDDTTRKVGHISTHYVKDTSGNIIPSDNLKNSKAKGTLCDKQDNEIMTGEFSVVANGSKSGDIIKLVYYEDGGDNTRTGATRAFKRGELSNGTTIGNYRNSLLDYTPEYWLDEPEIGLYINFTHAWVQNVAADPYMHNGWNTGKSINRIGTDDIPDLTLPNGEVPEPDIEHNSEGGACSGNAMNQLRFDDRNSNFEVNDFNSGSGWGYRNQNSYFEWVDQDESKKVNGNFPRHNISKNGVLICGGDFNNTSVMVDQCGGQRHDKWIIVYLKGDGYEGWYMGFDLEASDSTPNSQIGANGYCNDWIIKLSAVGGPGYEPWDARIMCEDLGGEDNTVNLGGGKNMTSDIDYNDIVIDIEKGTGTTSSVEITLQAAGGTLPLILSYKKSDNTEVPLFETHELFSSNNNIYDGEHTIAESGYRIMYNTGAEDGGGTSTSQKITLEFNPSATSTTIKGKTITINEPIPTGTDDSAFKAFMDKLQIKVYRHTTVDYLTSSNSLTSAEWQTLQNVEGEAPLMICVPKTTKWLKERNSIKLGYGGFPTWVQHPELYFWIPPGINEQFLYSSN